MRKPMRAAMVAAPFLLAAASLQAHHSFAIFDFTRDVTLSGTQMTVYDPVLFTGPRRITHRYQDVKGVDRMIHEDCEGNDRNPLVDGKFTLK